MLKEIVIAVQSYFKAHRFIMANGLWKWVLLPGILYALLFGFGMQYFGRSANTVIEYITNLVGIRDFIQKWENSWLGFFFTFTAIVFWIILMLFYFSLFKYVWLILGSPIYAYLSERTSAAIEGREYAPDNRLLLKDMGRGVLLALRNLLWQTVYIASTLFLTLLPIVGWATPLLAFFMECYYFGFSMLDYSCERKGMSRAAGIEYVGRHRGLAIGNGMVFFLMHLALGIGWVFAPSYAIVAATISMHETKP
jgi:CysZ protein